MPVVIALGIHFYVVYTIAGQPLNVNGQQPSTRSAIWVLHNDTVHRIGPAADFFAVYHAGHALQQGLSPYENVESPRRTPYFYPFRYLPLVGYTIGYFSIQFEPRAAYQQWLVVLELCLLAIIVLFATRTNDRRIAAVTTCVLLLSTPYFLELHMGQFTFLTLSLLVMGVLLLERPPPVFRGLWASVISTVGVTAAVLLKVLPLVTTPAFLRIRRYWPGIGLAALAVLAVSLPHFMRHAGEWQAFRSANFSDPVGGMDAGNYGLVYLIYRIGDELQLQGMMSRWQDFASTWYMLVVGVTAVVVMLSRCTSLGMGVAALVMAHFVGYSQVWEHHMSGVVVVGCLMLHAMRQDETYSGRLEVVVIGALIVLALPTPFVWLDTAKDIRVWDPSTEWPAWSRYALIMSKAVPATILYGVAMTWLFRSGFTRPFKV